VTVVKHEDVEFFAKPYNFGEFYKAVISWNLLFREGVADFSEGAIEFQKKLVQEEFKEALAEYENKNKAGFLAELIDLAVVGIYWDYLRTKDELIPFGKTKHDTWYVTSGLSTSYYAQEFISHNGVAEYIEYDNSYLLLLNVFALIKEFDANVSGAIKAILAANESKFPYVESVMNPILEAEQIEKASNGRYTGIWYKIIVDKDGKERYIFLDSNHKVMKPTSFKKADITKFA
jgi:hypothetical protein